MDFSPILLVGAAFALLVYVLIGTRQVKQWEILLVFTLGRYAGKKGAGLRFFMPILQRIRRVDMRTRNRDLFRQAVITKDNITLSVDAIVYFRVVDADRAILAVEDFEAAMKDRAKVVLRDVIGEIPLDEVLAHREQIAARIQSQIEAIISRWGLHVELIGLQDIQLPHQMQEVLAKAAIAERERSYVIIKSEADIASARNFAEAAQILVRSPGALELRRFETLQNLNPETTSKVIFDLARHFGEAQKAAIAMATSLADTPPRSPRAEPPQPRASGQDHGEVYGEGHDEPADAKEE